MSNVWVSASVWVGLRPPRHRGEAMHPAQTIAASRVLPWLPKEQAYAEEEYRKVAVRFVNIGNEFLTKLWESKIPELSRMPNAPNSERGFRVFSRFRFEELINIARPASPLRYFRRTNPVLVPRVKYRK